MTPQNESISVKELHKTFDEQVLAGITFSVGSGQIVVVVGPNGCGKTTLLRIIAGLVSGDDGRVDVATEVGRARNLGIVFQKPLLLPWLTVSENIELPTKIDPTHQVISVDDLLVSLDLGTKKDAYPSALSGGEAQKVALARALVTNPRILLLDEPFASLDESKRRKLQIELLDLRLKTGATIVFVTHDLDEAVFLADRVLVLRNKPSCVTRDISIMLPHPRQRESRQFEEMVIEVRRGLFDNV